MLNSTDTGCDGIASAARLNRDRATRREPFANLSTSTHLGACSSVRRKQNTLTSRVRQAYLSTLCLCIARTTYLLLLATCKLPWRAGPPSTQASSSIPCIEPILIPEVGRDRALLLLSPAFLSFRCRHAQPQKASFPYHPPSNWEEGRDGWMDGWMRSPP